MLKKGVYFISGIDTDAGKSYATGLLALMLKNQGLSVVTHKFIQTGGDMIDIKIHREVMGEPLSEEDIEGLTSPEIFSYPASPHLAAKLEGREIDFAKIESSISELSERYEIVLTEGAGGLHVPLKGLYTTLDYITERGLPIIFVTSGRLGSINHTLLSLEVCRSRGVEVALVLYNSFFDNDKIISEDSFNYFKNYLGEYHKGVDIVKI